MTLGDLQACPWCSFVGTPTLFDLHMQRHEQADEQRCQDEDILHEIKHERVRQDAKWGEQNHPDGTGAGNWAAAITPIQPWDNEAEHVVSLAKQLCERHAAQGKLTFLDILLEEIAEAFAETDEQLLRAELVQCAAVIVNWIGAIDRRATLSRNNQQENEKGKES